MNQSTRKIFAGLLSLAMVLTLVAGVAVSANAQTMSATFTRDLTVGSRGADVTALQTILNTNGYLKVSPTGYFGSLTRAALAAWQAANGISPAVGYFGPISRAAIGSAGPVACPAGLVCTPTTPVACPVGYVCTPANGTGVTTTGVVGTLSASLWTSPSGVVAYKGQSYDVVSYKLQASASDMALHNLSLDFDARLWLYASAITIKDDAGVTVAQVNNLNSTNFTEITVGSDYRLNVPISNYVVKATQTRYLTANITFLPTSDRATGTINITQMQVRSTDGTNVTDTETVGNGATSGNGSADRSISYQGSGAGSIIVTTDSTTPVTGNVQLSTSAQTQNVPLAVYDIKSANAPSTLRSLSIVIKTNNGFRPTQLFNNVLIQVGSQTYSANSFTDVGTVGTMSSSTATFTSLSIPLSADVYTPIRILANTAVDTNNIYDNTMASTTWTVAGTVGATTNNPSVEDQSFNTLAVNGATFSSNNLTFTASSVNLGSLSTTYGNAINNSTTGSTTQQFTFSYALTAGTNPIYVSRTASGAAISTTTSPAGISISSTDFSDSDTSGDGSTYFYIAPGQTKTFNAIYSASGLTTNSGTIYVTGLNYGTTTGALTAATLSSSNISTGLKAVLFH